MAKAKSATANASIANKHLYSRMSYLYQAASYLSTKHLEKAISQRDAATQLATEERSTTATTIGGVSLPGSILEGATAGNCTHQSPIVSSANGSSQMSPTSPTLEENLPLARHLLSNLRAVSRKGQIRVSADIKHSICKRCETLLIPGSTSTHRISNASRGGKKPWADVFVVRCKWCRTEKRFPVGAKKNLRKKDRGEKEIHSHNTGCTSEQEQGGDNSKPSSQNTGEVNDGFEPGRYG